MTTSDATTLRLNDTVNQQKPDAAWLVWSGLGARGPIKLGDAPLLLGRGEAEPGRLDFPGVSRRHAEVTRRGPLLVIRDLGSTNGTFLNGVRIQDSALSDGDVVRLGDAVAVVLRQRDELGAPRVEEPIPGVLFGPGLAELLSSIRRLAADDLPIVIEGATGVGKEGVARALHELSGRRGALQAVNCGALPPSLAESELFGHRKGAFTGAEQAGLGHVRAAHNGTLFLDELYDLAPAVQTKLLRVLQEKQVLPLGETRSVHVDVRVIAASLVPLSELVAQRRLREDLAARLAGVSLVVPPLAARRVDIPILLEYFLQKHSGGHAPRVDGKLLEYLLLSPWPGNVRELQLLARRLLSLHGHEPVLRRSMVDPESSKAPTTSQRTPQPRKSVAGADAELQLFRAHLRRHGNVSRAAQESGISRQRAYRLLAGRSPRELLEEQGPVPELGNEWGEAGSGEEPPGDG